MVKREWRDKSIVCSCARAIPLNNVIFKNGSYECPHKMVRWTEKMIDAKLNERRYDKNV